MEYDFILQSVKYIPIFISGSGPFIEVNSIVNLQFWHFDIDIFIRKELHWNKYIEHSEKLWVWQSLTYDPLSVITSYYISHYDDNYMLNFPLFDENYGPTWLWQDQDWLQLRDWTWRWYESRSNYHQLYWHFIFL